MDFIDDIIKREGGSKETNDPNDSGGRTKYGIAEAFNPAAWTDGDVTLDEARAIYTDKYILTPGFHHIEDPYLMEQMVDFGVNAGPKTSIKLLQEVLKVTRDGDLGPLTLKAIADYPAGFIFGQSCPGPVMLNLAFRDARVRHYGRLVQRVQKNIKFLSGWLNRALEFI